MANSVTENVDVVQQQAVRLSVLVSDENKASGNPAFVLLEKDHFSYETRPIPQLPTPKHVVVAVKATGLCGSDIHYWQHGKIGNFEVRQPLILGHESAGTIRRCGSDVQSLAPGDEVAIEPGIPCRTCPFCKDGRYNLCENVEFAATPPYDGTLQKYYVVPEDYCYKLPTGISLQEGALLEPLSVAVHCAKLANIGFGSSVLVLGAGPIGLLCCATARAFGAVNVTAVDVVPARLEFAQKYAATATYQMKASSPEDNACQVMSRTEKSKGFDIVIDATGVQSCIIMGIHAMKRGGKFIQAGLGAAEILFPVAQLCSKEGSFLGSFRYSAGDYNTALKLLENGSVQVRDLITHEYPFEEARIAFETVLQRKGIKTIILGPDTV